MGRRSAQRTVVEYDRRHPGDCDKMKKHTDLALIATGSIALTIGILIGVGIM